LSKSGAGMRCLRFLFLMPVAPQGMAATTVGCGGGRWTRGKGKIYGRNETSNTCRTSTPEVPRVLRECPRPLLRKLHWPCFPPPCFLIPGPLALRTDAFCGRPIDGNPRHRDPSRPLVPRLPPSGAVLLGDGSREKTHPRAFAVWRARRPEEVRSGAKVLSLSLLASRARELDICGALL